MAKRKKADEPAKDKVVDYRHRNASRLNIPPAGLAARGEIAREKKVQYAYNPHLAPVLRFDGTGGADRISALLEQAGERPLNEDEVKLLQEAFRNHEPWLEWAGKREQPYCVADPVALHLHERISTQAILRAVKREDIQRDLFADPEQEYREAVQFYRHPMDWTNRMILGDSLAVMASLARREALAGKVQMIYMDPPYGIKYASNFQPEVGRRDVKDRDEDLTREPEMVKAYRDTWTLGVHSYLSYLRDRLLLCRELLADTGSVFVQISDENLHRVRCLMDEVFGADNFVSQITFRTKIPLRASLLANVGDYLLWYAKDNSRLKYKKLFVEQILEETELFNYADLSSGLRVSISDWQQQFSEQDGLRFTSLDLSSSGATPSCIFSFEYQGRTFGPTTGKSWKTNQDGMARLAQAERLFAPGSALRYVLYHADYPIAETTNLWTDTLGAAGKVYVVQTNAKVIERCLLMTTDPGDLVLDPTCVRKGTRVLIPLCSPEGSTPLDPPASGGKSTLPASGGKRVPAPLVQDLTPSPHAGRVGEGSSSGFAGRVGEGPLPIEEIQPGDFVYAHDGQPHRVLRTLKRPYSGLVIGLRHEQSDQPLWLTADHLILTHRRVQALSAQGGWQGIPDEHFGRARALRKGMSPPERKLWKHLCSAQVGVKFRRQHPIGPYITDFYARQAGLVVEVDGSTHYASSEIQQYDHERDQYMETLGLRVLRFTVPQVMQQTEAVIRAISTACQEQVLPEEPEKQWRRAGELQVGDIVYHGIDKRACQIVAIDRQQTQEEVYDLEVEDVHSFLTEVCAIHNCGSGTTAYVAEQWGRRWITTDVSRVALAIARQRLLTAKFDYYQLRPTSAEDVQRNPNGSWLSDPTGQIEGSCTFDCKTVPHVTLKSIAQNQALDPIFDKWAPVLAEKLAALNAALAQTVTRELRQKLQDKLYRKLNEEGKRAITDADERRWRLPEKEWKDWEVPFDADSDWPQDLQQALTAYRQAWRQKMDEVNACIAARADQEELVDQPYVDRGRVRVSGPFTMEGIIPAEESIQEESPIAGAPETLDTFGSEAESIQSEAQNTEAYLDRMVRLLREDGVRFPDNKVVKFNALEALADGALLHAQGAWGQDGEERQVAVMFGPQYGPLIAPMVEDGIRLASRRGYDDLVFAAFSFDGAAQAALQEDPDPRVRMHMAQIRPDVNMGDLLKTTVSSQIFTVSGMPRIELRKAEDGQHLVEMQGVDIYDPVTNTVRSTGAEKVAAWFLDADYDGRCFCVTQAFFPDKSAWEKLGKALGNSLDTTAFEKLSGTVSLPFPEGPHKRVAVKVIDPRGNEVLSVHRLGTGYE